MFFLKKLNDAVNADGQNRENPMPVRFTAEQSWVAVKRLSQSRTKIQKRAAAPNAQVYPQKLNVEIKPTG